jgi:hypothetical protein
MAKQKENENFQSNGDVCKTNSGSRIIGGWFSVFKLNGSDVVDRDNEVVDIASYNDAFIDFSKNYRDANFDHDGVIKGCLIDNILIDSEEMAKMIVSEITGMNKEDIPVVKLGHFGSFQITEQSDYDEAIKNKLMFSIEGLCSREEISEDE